VTYTLRLSKHHSRTLRRIAWATGAPMTKTMKMIFDWLPDRMDEEKVCSSCRDREFCSQCPFYKPAE